MSNEKTDCISPFLKNDTITQIPKGMYENCRNQLINLTLDTPNLLTIGEEAFKGFEKLEKVIIIESSLQTIGNQAFCGCTNLKSFYIPETVLEIGEGAFENCISMNSFVFAENSQIEVIKKRTFHSTNITVFEAPKMCQEIQDLAFQSSGIRRFIFGKNIVSISNTSFLQSDLAKLTIFGLSSDSVLSVFKPMTTIVEIRVMEKIKIDLNQFYNKDQIKLVTFEDPDDMSKYKSRGWKIVGAGLGTGGAITLLAFGLYIVFRIHKPLNGSVVKANLM